MPSLVLALLLTATIDDVAPPIAADAANTPPLAPVAPTISGEAVDFAAPQEPAPAMISLEAALALRGFAVIVDLIDDSRVDGELRAVDAESLRVATATGEVLVPLARVRALRKRFQGPPPTSYAAALPSPDEAPSMSVAAGFAGAGACIGCGVGLVTAAGASCLLFLAAQPSLLTPVLLTSALAVPAAGAAGGALVSTHDDPHGFVVAAGAAVGAVAGLVVGGVGSFMIANATGPIIGCGFAGVCAPNLVAVGAIGASAIGGAAVGGAAGAAGAHQLMYGGSALD